MLLPFALTLMGFMAIGSTSTTNSAPECRSEAETDPTVYLQSHHSLALTGASSAMKRQCDFDQVNTGICHDPGSQTQVCFDCEAQTVPTNATRFPEGSLFCRDSSMSPRMSACDSSSFTFRNPNDFWDCKGISCRQSSVHNAGAACFASDGSVGRSAKVWLAHHSTCTRDICCDAEGACRSTRFKDVNSLSCRGRTSCTRMAIELSKNLYCDTESLISDPEFEQLFTCGDSQIGFTAHSESGTTADHCLSCLGRYACYNTRFSWLFSGGRISQVCDGNQACWRSSWVLPADTHMLLECTGEGACDQIAITCAFAPAFYVNEARLQMICTGPDTCRRSRVVLEGESTLHLTCAGTGSCDSMTVAFESSDSVCRCEFSNGGACPENCTADAEANEVAAPASCAGTDSACCAGDALAEDKTPQCSKCGRAATPSEPFPCPDLTTCNCSGQGVGDPHMTTLLGQRYLLLQQGTFSFWRFSGSLSVRETFSFVK